MSRNAISSVFSNMPLAVAALSTCACALLVSVDAITEWSVPGLESVELSSLDARFKMRGATRAGGDGPASDIVIVGFDDALRREAPEVFQRRAEWARFIDKLKTYDPKVVGVDAFFSSPEVVLPDGVLRRVRRAHRDLAAEAAKGSRAVQAAQKALGEVVEAARGDEVLAASLRRSGGVFLAVLFFLERGEVSPLAAGAAEPIGLAGASYDEGVVLGNARGLRPPRAEAALYASLPTVATAVDGAGYVNVVKDADGKVRQIPGAIEHGGRFYAPLGLVLARRWLGSKGDLSHVAGEKTIRLGDRALPADATGKLQLGFLAPGGGFPVYSAAEVLSGRLPKDRLRGKLVLVGYTDAARDRVATPFDEAVPGVVLHATLAHNALNHGLLALAHPLLSPLMVLLLGLLLTLAQLQRLRQRRAWLAGATAAALSLAWLVAAQVLFSAGVIVPVAAPVAATVVIALITMTTALATEGREKARLRAAFSQYVTKDLVDRIANDPTRIQLGGERRELSVLFSDIRAFSRFSERMQPEELSDFLNEYLTPMTELVMSQGGMLDKYIGDAVMAVYGAPLPMEDHAAAACRSALAMSASLRKLNPVWTGRGLPEIRIGVGVNSGDVSVGNMGSQVRFDYTVIGDSVNLAARLEALTKEYGTEVLVGPATAALAAHDMVFRELDYVQVKGRGGVVTVFELLGEARERALFAPCMQAYADALSAYRARDWDAAKSGFAAVLALRPDDGPARVMLDRVAVLETASLGADWDGVYAQRSK